MSALHQFRSSRCIHCGVDLAISGYSEVCPAREFVPSVPRPRRISPDFEMPPIHPERQQATKYELWLFIGLPIGVVVGGSLLLSFMDSGPDPKLYPTRAPTTTSTTPAVNTPPT